MTTSKLLQVLLTLLASPHLSKEYHFLNLKTLEK